MTGLISGLGYGLYITVDFALLLDVLREEATVGNDMAVWHQVRVHSAIFQILVCGQHTSLCSGFLQSWILPQFLAVPIAGVLVDGLQHVDCEAALGYVVLFSVAAFYFTLSGLFILMVRKVR